MSAPFLSIPAMVLHLLGRIFKEVRALKGLVGMCPPITKLLLMLLQAALPHHWDNVSTVKAAAQAGWHIGIVHGAKDQLVPMSMGCELFQHCGPSAEFVEVPQASHNDVCILGCSHYVRLMGWHPESSLNGVEKQKLA